jgi:hypothetical protein
MRMAVQVFLFIIIFIFILFSSGYESVHVTEIVKIIIKIMTSQFTQFKLNILRVGSYLLKINKLSLHIKKSVKIIIKFNSFYQLKLLK